MFSPVRLEVEGYEHGLMAVFRTCFKKHMPISDPPFHRTKWLLMKCIKLQPTLRCLLILTQHYHCIVATGRGNPLRKLITWLDLEAVSETNQGLVPWCTHISLLLHQILYVCVIFGHGKWWKVDETERTPWSVAAGCYIRTIIKLWIQQSAGNVFISWQPCICML